MFKTPIFGTWKDKDGKSHYEVNGEEVTKKIYDDLFGECFENLRTRIPLKQTLSIKPDNLEEELNQKRVCSIYEFGGKLCIIAEAKEYEYTQTNKYKQINQKIKISYNIDKKISTIFGINLPVNLEKYLPFEENLNLEQVDLSYQNGILEIKIPKKP